MSETKVLTDLVPCESCEGESIPCLFLLLVVCWQPLVFLGLEIHQPNLCLHVHMVFSQYVLSGSKFLLFIRTQSYWIKTHFNDLILT